MSELQLPFIMTCKDLFLECDCGLLEHLVKVSYEPYDWDDQEKDPDRLSTHMYLHVHLFSWRGVFRRLWVAIKYVLGYRCRYGEWDEFILSTMDVIRLRQFLEQYLEEIDK